MYVKREFGNVGFICGRKIGISHQRKPMELRQKLMKKLKQHMALRLGSNASCTLRGPVLTPLSSLIF